MARALSIVRHQVTEYDKWRAVYEEVQPLRDKHGVSGPPRIEVVVEA